jgi:hypothetical protein
MPTFDASTPRIDLKVNGVPCTAPAPYAAGDTLTTELASFLNRQVATAVANPIPSRIKRAEAEAKEAGKKFRAPTPEELQAHFDEAYSAYNPGAINRSTAEPADPVEKAARQLATAKVNELLSRKGKSINAVKAAKDAEGNSVYQSLVTQFLAANPGLYDIARAQVDAMKAMSADVDIDIPEGVEQPAEAAAE